MRDCWNPWHGCRKYSEGCQNCYVYRRDGTVGRDAGEVKKTGYFNLPVKKDRQGSFKVPDGSLLYTCLTSDFFLPEADEWRPESWKMIRQRPGVKFFIITKRIVRFNECIPEDWGEGYPNVIICCTMENQRQADIRFPVLNSIRAKEKQVICEPLLSEIDIGRYLTKEIKGVTVGGESGDIARECDYNWVLDIRRQCVKAGVAFNFKQTGTRFIKDGKLYIIERKYQHVQAKKAGIDI